MDQTEVRTCEFGDTLETDIIDHGGLGASFRVYGEQDDPIGGAGAQVVEEEGDRGMLSKWNLHVKKLTTIKTKFLSIEAPEMQIPHPST